MTAPSPTLPRALTPLQARVLGVLVEKQSTVPDSYPMSLLALTTGCNQKSARQPVFESSEADVAAAVDALRAFDLVVEGSGSRVVRFEHNLPRRLQLPSQAAALLAVLALRGPQTAAELRLNSERLHRFADASSVEGFLDELAARRPPLAVRLARASGARESRWASCLTGPVEAAAATADALPTAPPHGLDRGRPFDAGMAAAGDAGAERSPFAAAAATAATAAGATPAAAASAAPTPPASAGLGSGGLRFVLPAQRRLLHALTIPIRWGDMDAMGHVNNTVYFRFMEIVRLDWIARCGVPLAPHGQGPVIVNAFCNFLRQLEFPGEVRVTLSVGDIGKSSFDTFHTIERSDEPGVAWAEGGARVVWTDFAARRSLPLPAWFAARLHVDAGASADAGREQGPAAFVDDGRDRGTGGSPERD